jgi:acyl-CoA synthetase (AMP-forming)/AMP-acid ligase II
MKTLSAMWSEAERAYPNIIAVVAAGTRFTYREIGEQIRGLAFALADRWHVGEGSVDALLAPNCPEFVVSYFAVVSLGAIIQPIDGRLTAGEIELIISDSQADLLIVHHSLRHKVEPIQHTLTSLKAVIGIGLEEDGVERFVTMTSAKHFLSEPPVYPGTIAELMYTSGTTGHPKGVMRSHANVLAATRNSIRGFGYRQGDIIAIVMPLSHSSALNSQMMPLLQLGGTLVLIEGFDVHSLLDTIRQEQVTCLRAVPTMLRLLLTSSAFCSEQLPTLRLLMNSSGPIDPHTFVTIKHRFASIEVMNSYGLTEASTCTVLTDEGMLEHPDSIGQPIEGVEMEILNEDGNLLEGERNGEIAVRGEHVFVGYYRQPEAYQALFQDGWLRTRDLGHRDAKGYYYLEGRTDDFINCGGHKYAPVEVENCILQLHEVAEVAVVGEAHPILGEVGKAFVVLHDFQQVDTKRIVYHCTHVLPSHKVPFYVEIVSELPKNAVGKILRGKLKEERHGC